MSQAGIVDVEGSHPQIPTSFVSNMGTAIPLLNVLEILGTTVAAHSIPLETLGSGNTVTIEAQYASAAASSLATNAGFASFNSAYFTVDANGYVTFKGSAAIESFMVDAATAPGTNPVVPNGSGIVTITGGQVAAGTTANVIRTNSLAANSYTIQIQRSQAVASSTVGDNGVCHFNSTDFTVDANGFVSFAGTTPYYSLTPYIVGTDVHSQYATIGAAISAAVTAGVSSTNPANIYIKPKNGGYTENPVVVDGINLVGFGGQTVINGKVLMATAGSATITGLTFQDNGDYSLEASGSSNSIIYVRSCNFNVIANTPIHMNSSGGLMTLDDCYGANSVPGAAIFVVQAGSLELDNCVIAGSSTASTTATSLGIFNSALTGPITTTGTSNLAIVGSFLLAGVITINSTSVNQYINNTMIQPGTGIALTIGAGAQCIVSHCPMYSSATNVITGSGTLFYAFLSFPGGSSGVSVSTATPIPTLI